jgi:PAS domain S-box-containing protein
VSSGPSVVSPPAASGALDLECFRRALDDALDLHAFVQIDDGRFCWVNRAWTELLGWTAEELYARPYADFVHPADLAASAVVLAHLKRGEPVVRFRNRYRHRDGRWSTLQWCARTPGPDGRIFCTVRPAGERVPGSECDDRLHLMEDFVGIGHWRMDLWDGTFGISEASCVLLGLAGLGPRTDLPDLWRHLEAEGHAELMEALQAFSVAEDVFERTVPVRFLGGEPRVVRLSGRPAHDTYGRRIAVSGIAVDETDRARQVDRLGARAARAERAAARAEALLALSETTARSFSELYSAYSQAGRDYTGLPGGGVFTYLGGALEATPPRRDALSDAARHRLLGAVRDARPLVWEAPAPSREILLAAPIRVHFTMRGVLAFFGSTERAEAVAEDLEFVTLAAMALGRAIETLESARHTGYQRSLFEGLFRQTPDGIFLEDARQRRVLMVNDALCGMLGYARDEMVGRRATYIFASAGDFEALGDDPYGAPESEDHALRELVLRRKDGSSIPVELVSTRVRGDRGEPLAVMRHVRDITARQRMEAMKQEFIAVASHELRTPLTATLGSLALLREVAAELPEDSRELVDLAHRSGDRLRALVDDILDIQRLEGGQLPLAREPFDLRRLVRDGLESHAGMARSYEVGFVLEPGGSARVYADARRIMQVLTNLLSNACKHSPAGGEVRVTVETETKPDGAWVVCAVKDQGPGIPPDFRSRVFEKFAQADSTSTRRTSGSGLGLAITRAIVDEHGGRIDFRCPESGGTVFTFRLPQCLEAPGDA